MLKAQFAKYFLQFKEPARTSREVMTEKLTYFIRIFDEADPLRFGIGECALFPGLSCDDVADYEQQLRWACSNINDLSPESLRDYPSIRFGAETALADFNNGCVREPFPSFWTRQGKGIVINGLVWMGSIDEMRRRIDQKLDAGFTCLKFKIGGEDFGEELELLRRVRKDYSPDELEIRLDANGAFPVSEAIDRLTRLSELSVHSIEQPVEAGNWEAMARICAESPIPIALDEELIGVNDPERKYKMLESIKPDYIILKPALCGGLSGAAEWISIANLLDIGWWCTSALESNVGLNAIAQWVSQFSPALPQGLGTGALFTNNVRSPIEQRGESLFYNKQKNWSLPIDILWQ